MRLISKITWLSVGLGVMMVVILIGLSLISFRFFSVTTAENLSRTAAEIVRVALTESMINGVIQKRDVFFQRLKGIDGLLEVRVIRGPQVKQQFGEGLEVEQSFDETEEVVLATGRPVFITDESGDHPMFRATIPYIADNSSTPPCTSCHQVEVNSVLGAITLTISLAHLRDQALYTVALLLIPVILIAVILVVLFRRMIKPLSATAIELRATVEEALEGDFTGRIQAHTSDEVGEIAEEVNQLMEFLYNGLNDISADVAHLTQTEPAQGNMLVNTRGMVGRLIDAAQFKQSIEEDETPREVYERLAGVLNHEFGVSQFSIYEVTNDGTKMVPVNVDGDSNADCRWCDPQIMVRAETCRCRRTGHVIDGVASRGICNAFAPSGESAEKLRHICLPVMQSGAVGSVVQMVFSEDQAARVQSSTPYLSVYLREAAPVIEAKRLMDTLRESTLRDPMTGLHNRRFLEEYIESLVAGAQRRNKQLSILMLDLDYFKKVNDTHGHDAGDVVLKDLSRILNNSVRSADLVIRFGGEEFLIILQDTSADYGDQVAEKIRVAVEATKFRVAGGVIEKTISVGIADFPTDADTFWQAMKYADVALYKAKDQGRNRVVHFSPEMWSDEEQY